MRCVSRVIPGSMQSREDLIITKVNILTDGVGGDQISTGWSIEERGVAQTRKIAKWGMGVWIFEKTPIL